MLGRDGWKSQAWAQEFPKIQGSRCSLSPFTNGLDPCFEFVHPRPQFGWLWQRRAVSEGVVVTSNPTRTLCHRVVHRLAIQPQ